MCVFVHTGAGVHTTHTHTHPTPYTHSGLHSPTGRQLVTAWLLLLLGMKAWPLKSSVNRKGASNIDLRTDFSCVQNHFPKGKCQVVCLKWLECMLCLLVVEREHDRTTVMVRTLEIFLGVHVSTLYLLTITIHQPASLVIY
jgi:hypothetical protein